MRLKSLTKVVNFLLIKEIFEFNPEEKKLVKSYQIITQYLMFSSKHLERKKETLIDLQNQQINYNSKADEVIEKQV